jgi:hypothetical protein
MHEKIIKNTTEPTNNDLIHPTPEAPVEKLAEKPSGDTPEKTPKARSIEALETATPASMTRNEAMKYIKYLREENEKLLIKIKALEENAKSAFAKADYIARTTESVERAYIEHLDYALSSLNNVKLAIENSAQLTVSRVSNIKKGM